MLSSTGLVYVTDQEPGITRHKCGTWFSYRWPDGTTLERGPERQRIQSLGIPPAYSDVWICTLAEGHLQATGRDAAQRKQYRYHPDWSSAQAATKFDALPKFGALLPRIRRALRRDIEADLGSEAFCLAAALMTIDRLSMRVGNAAYTEENGTYGATTLRNRHLRFKDGKINVAFTAKGGKRVRKQIGDRTLQRVLEKVSDLPGAEVFSWIDDDGKARALTSQGLNGYLADIAKSDAFTTKTFRTWAGTVAAFEVAEKGHATIKEITQAAAKRLHNTQTVARNSYVHPKVIDLAGADPLASETAPKSGLFASEARLLHFLT